MNEYMTPYELAKWQWLAKRDKEESIAPCSAVPPPAFVDRVADDYEETDAISAFSINHDWSKT